MSPEAELGAFVRSISVPRQENNPDITVVRLDIHSNGFVVRCEIGGDRGLMPTGPTALDLRDSLHTRYQRLDAGDDFISYAPAIPTGAEWLEVLTLPTTRIDLSE